SIFSPETSDAVGNAKTISNGASCLKSPNFVKLFPISTARNIMQIVASHSERFFYSYPASLQSTLLHQKVLRNAIHRDVFRPVRREKIDQANASIRIPLEVWIKAFRQCSTLKKIAALTAPDLGYDLPESGLLHT